MADDESTQEPDDTTKALSGLLDAMDEQLDAAGVDPGAEPEAYKFAAGLLGRDPRRAAKMPNYLRSDGTYVLVGVFERSLADDKETLLAEKRTPAEQLAVELQEACEAAGMPASFYIAEPSRDAAEGFETANSNDPDAWARDAKACALGPRAMPVLRQLLKALGSRDVQVIQNARILATALLGNGETATS